MSIMEINMEVITSLYGMAYEPDEFIQEGYAIKRQKAIETLGDKYRLANPIRLERNDNETITVSSTDISIRVRS